MIKCDSFHRISDKCVFCMDGYESKGGSIICDIAEECKAEEEILQRCQYATKICGRCGNEKILGEYCHICGLKFTESKR